MFLTEKRTVENQNLCALAEISSELAVVKYKQMRLLVLHPLVYAWYAPKFLPHWALNVKRNVILCA